MVLDLGSSGSWLVLNLGWFWILIGFKSWKLVVLDLGWYWIWVGIGSRLVLVCFGSRLV